MFAVIHLHPPPPSLFSSLQISGGCCECMQKDQRFVGTGCRWVWQAWTGPLHAAYEYFRVCIHVAQRDGMEHTKICLLAAAKSLKRWFFKLIALLNEHFRDVPVIFSNEHQPHHQSSLVGCLLGFQIHTVASHHSSDQFPYVLSKYHSARIIQNINSIHLTQSHKSAASWQAIVSVKPCFT